MSAKHALLGLLLDRPAYPYQMAAQLQERLGPAWKVNSGQLYHAIGRLEKAGLIERAQDASPDPEGRHVFQITDAGVSEFERFFAEAPDGARLARRPLLVKITFAGPQRLPDALAKLDAYERKAARALKEISRRRERLYADDPHLRANQLLLRLNLSADVFQLEAELRWTRHAREMLSWLASRDGAWRSDAEPKAAEPKAGQ